MGQAMLAPPGLRQDPLHRQRARRQAADGRRVEDGDAAVARARRQRAGAGLSRRRPRRRWRPARRPRSSATADRCASRRSASWSRAARADEFADRVAAAVAALRVGSGLDPADAGRSAHQREAARPRVEALVARRGARRGGTCRSAGGRPTQPTRLLLSADRGRRRRAGDARSTARRSSARCCR